MSDFATATERDEQWPNDPPFTPRTGGPHMVVLLALLAEGITFVVMGAWLLVSG